MNLWNDPVELLVPRRHLHFTPPHFFLALRQLNPQDSTTKKVQIVRSLKTKKA
jgi:hypothetical protein